MKKRKRGVDYNEEIPFEKRPPPGNTNHLHYTLICTLYDPHICHYINFLYIHYMTLIYVHYMILIYVHYMTLIYVII